VPHFAGCALVVHFESSLDDDICQPFGDFVWNLVSLHLSDDVTSVGEIEGGSQVDGHYDCCSSFGKPLLGLLSDVCDLVDGLPVLSVGSLMRADKFLLLEERSQSVGDHPLHRLGQNTSESNGTVAAGLVSICPFLGSE
jgi:hypothetical protein